MRRAILAALAALALAAPARGEFTYKPAVTVTVGTSATILMDAGFSHVYVCNQDVSKVVFWSWNDAGLTATTGSPLNPGTCLTFAKMALNQVLRGVVASGTADVRVSKGNGADR